MKRYLMKTKKMKIKLKWHKFLCKVFGHKWHNVSKEDPKYRSLIYNKCSMALESSDIIITKALGRIGWTLLVCLRCAETKRVLFPPEHPNCLCTIISNEGFDVSSKPPPEWLGTQKGENNEDKNKPV